ncbi:MAG: hypothetical protein P1U56_00110 [Saprospiraceae bacterium]|nr:hypothetical protein [Saprospiraceae bacterium]
MPKKMKKEGKPVVHEDLDGFNIKINAFGEMETTVPIDKLNTFLNDKVEDKKLSNSEEE